MKEFIQTIFNTLEEEIALFNEMGIKPVKKMASIISAVRTALAKLRTYLKMHPFADEAAEINFFKYEKPRFVAEQLYAVELYTIANGRPLGDEVLLRNYYEQELRFIKRFLDQHQFLYQYYLLDGDELDHAYFIRNIGPPTLFLPDAPDTDPEFSTACDYLFARFMACERLQDYLIGCLYQRVGVETSMGARVNKRPRNWTGDKANLIELAYGIYATTQINGGDVTIAEIIDWLEESFKTSLSRYSHRLAEIKMRKSISLSKYLDEMREAFLRYIEEGDAFEPRVSKPMKPPR